MRVISFITLLFLSTLLPWYLILPFAFVYALFWEAYELIAIGVCIDAYFGTHHVLPYYTIVVSCMLIVLEWAKPHLLIYNK